MITIPMQVAATDYAVPMTVTVDNQVVGMSIGAEYAVAGANPYEGEYEVTPKARQAQVLETANKLMEENVIVLEVPYYQTSNQYGDTVYIASEV